MKKYRQCLLPPVCAGICCLIIFACFQLFPFAQNTLSWCDMNQQVVPLLLDFKNILLGQADLFLNLSNAGGTSFWGILLFFVASPFSFFVLLIDNKDIYLFANILVLIKIMVCAGTASIFFRKIFFGLPVLQNIALSIMYAFCGYTMMYFQNVVWLDAMYMFPILLLGLDCLINREKVLIYIISLSCIITIHFYLSYMVAIFLILAISLYVWFCVPKKKRRKIICLFGISTMIVLCITGVIWLPSLLQYLQSGRGVGLLESLSSGDFITEIYTSLPVILCTGMIITIVPLYFLFQRYKSKKSNIIGILFILTTIPIFIEPINKMWHTGSYQAFPVRYGYITIFLGLILAADLLHHFRDQINHSRESNKKNRWTPIALSVAAVGVIALALCFLSTQWSVLSTYTKTLHGSYSFLGIILLFASAVALFYFFTMLLYYLRLIKNNILSIFLCLITVTEVLFFSSIYFGSASRSTISNESVLDLASKISDTTLYRVKMDKKYFDVNMMGALGYNSLSHYTSFTNETYMFAMKKMGYSSYWMEVNSSGGTLFTDSLLGNRYHVRLNTEISDGQEIVYQNNKYSILKNELPARIGSVFVADDINVFEKLPNSTRADVQNHLFQSLYHTPDVLIKPYAHTFLKNIIYQQSVDGLFTINKQVAEEPGYLLYHIPVKGTQTLYFDCFHELSNRLVEPINSSFDIYINGKLIQNRYPTKNNNGLLELGTFSDETVIVRVNVLKDVTAKSFGVFGLDVAMLTQCSREEAEVSLQQQGNRVLGTAIGKGENSFLFLPISNAKGFKAEVNGQEVEIYTVFDTFMALPLQNGTNAITVSYIPVGFLTGGILSTTGIILCTGFVILLYKDGYRYIRFVEWIMYPLMFVLFAIVIIVVYIAPTIIYFIF